MSDSRLNLHSLMPRKRYKQAPGLLSARHTDQRVTQRRLGELPSPMDPWQRIIPNHICISSRVDTQTNHRNRSVILRAFGLGIITGAADDDCSAVGTYSQAGAAFGYALLWTAPLILPMMVTIVYLSSKLGQVTGKACFL